MTIASEIQRLQAAKQDILESIRNKGVTVPDATTLSETSALIDAIGGGGDDFVSIDGLDYKTMRIGTQVWMVENCQAVQGEASFYNDDEVTYGRNGLDYGRLYSYDEAVALGNRVNGWHLPTVNDWYRLFGFVGFTESAINLRATTYGSGRDNVGFNMLPAGLKGNNGTYYRNVEVLSLFWISESFSSSNAYYTYCLSPNAIQMTLDPDAYKMDRLSVRLVKDA